MAQTHTQTLHRTVVNQTRNHDYLYDPNYTLSSEKDHAKDAYRSHTKVDRVKRVPEFRQMFSALPHFPRYHLRLDPTDPVPKFINRRWKGYANQQREEIVRYTTFNYDPSVQLPKVHHGDPKVTGQNRYKYFRRPIIPFLQQVPPEVLLQPTTVDPLASPGEVLQRPPTPATRTIEIQTDYRDSEAQTDPFTPEYVVRPGSAPELLTLATLTYKHGLPAGLAEVEMIERARAKRAWEKTLPPLNDMSQLEKRKRMMDEMETKEWLLREQEIEKLQEERLEMLKKLLIQREIKQQELNDKRMDKLWRQKQKLKERKIHKIRKEHLRTIRRLTRNCENVEGKFERRDFVKDYGQFGSQTHAPLTRIGVFLDRGSEQYVVRSRFLNTFQGLLELEASLPDFVTQPRVRAPKRPPIGANGYVKKKHRLTKQLDDMYKAIKESETKKVEPPKPLRFLHKVEKPVPRPPTPRTEEPVESLEEAELAAIFIQKVLRGRAIQNMMFEGKEKRMELINEVRSTHALQKAEQQLKRNEKQNVVTLQRQRRLYQHKESYVNEVVSQIEGETIGDMVDFLSKELIRLQEERRIHAISMLAERRRRLREAEESGRRQVEERRRREEDEIFKQLLKIHQTTVDTYLEDIVMDAVDGTADEQAREEIREYADKINDIAYEMEETRTLLQSEEISSELVHCFLLPEVLKIHSREKVKQEQKKHLLAAHRIIHATTEPIIQEEDGRERSSFAPSPHPQSGRSSIPRSIGSPASGRGSTGSPAERSRKDPVEGADRIRSGSRASSLGEKAAVASSADSLAQLPPVDADASERPSSEHRESDAAKAPLSDAQSPINAHEEQDTRAASSKEDVRRTSAPQTSDSPVRRRSSDLGGQRLGSTGSSRESMRSKPTDVVEQDQVKEETTPVSPHKSQSPPLSQQPPATQPDGQIDQGEKAGIEVDAPGEEEPATTPKLEEESVLKRSDSESASLPAQEFSKEKTEQSEHLDVAHDQAKVEPEVDPDQTSDEPSPVEGAKEKTSVEPLDKSPPADVAPDQPSDESPPADVAPNQPSDESPPADVAPDQPSDKSPPTDVAPDQPSDKSPPADVAPDQPSDESPPADVAPDQPSDESPPADVAPDKPSDESPAADVAPDKPSDESPPADVAPDQPSHESPPVDVAPDQPSDESQPADVAPDQTAE